MLRISNIQVMEGKMVTFVTVLFTLAMIAAFGLIFYMAFGKQ